MPATQERATVNLPSDLSAALRKRVGTIYGSDIAELPLPLILRYIAAIIAGISPANARQYARALPRGDKQENYPDASELLRK